MKLNETTNERIARYAKNASGIEGIDLSFLPLEDQLEVLSKITEPGERFIKHDDPDEELYWVDTDRFKGHTLDKNGSRVYGYRFGYEIILKSLETIENSGSTPNIRRYKTDCIKKLRIMRDLLLVDDIGIPGVSISEVDSVLGDKLDVTKAYEALNRYAVTDRQRRINGCIFIIKEKLKGDLSSIADEGIGLMMDAFDDSKHNFRMQRDEKNVEYGKNFFELGNYATKEKRQMAIKGISKCIDELLEAVEAGWASSDYQRGYIFSHSKELLEDIINLGNMFESEDKETSDIVNQSLRNIKNKLLDFPRLKYKTERFDLGLVDTLNSSREGFTNDELYQCGENYFVRGDYKTANDFFERCGRRPDEAKIKEVVSQRIKRFQEKEYPSDDKRDPHVSEIHGFLDEVENIPKVLSSSIEEAKAVAMRYLNEKLVKAEETISRANEGQGWEVQRGYESVLPVYLLAKRLGIPSSPRIKDATFEYLYLKTLIGKDEKDNKLSKKYKRAYFGIMKDIYPQMGRFLEKLIGV